jgi:hypothetical protein
MFQQFETDTSTKLSITHMLFSHKVSAVREVLRIIVPIHQT